MSTIAIPTPTYVLMADLSSLVIRPPYIGSRFNAIESEIGRVRQDGSVGRLWKTPPIGVSQSGAAGTRATQTGSPKGEARWSERIKRPTVLSDLRISQLNEAVGEVRGSADLCDPGACKSDAQENGDSVHR